MTLTTELLLITLVAGMCAATLVCVGVGIVAAWRLTEALNSLSRRLDPTQEPDTVLRDGAPHEPPRPFTAAENAALRASGDPFHGQH